MKLIGLIISISTFLNLNAQVYIYTPFPASNQVLQRDSEDSSAIIVEGAYDSNTIKKLSLQILKDDILLIEKSISGKNEKGFNFNQKIKAGKFNYTIKLIANDQVLIREATNVVSGDLYLFYGQSNALGTTYADSYNLKQDLFTHILIQTDYDEVSGFWVQVIPSQTYISRAVGTFALEFARQLTSTNNYPIGIIQCAVGAKEITELTVNSDRPNYHSPYDKLLKSLDIAQARNNLKYIVFMQGEYDAPAYRAIQYATNFDIFYKKINGDLKNLKKFFNVQINILLKGYSDNSNDVETVREFQRTTNELYPKITTYSSVGITEFDGLHFYNAGYTKMGIELANIASNIIYKTISDPNVFSPNIKRIEKNEDGTQLILSFDEGQQMVYPNDTLIAKSLKSMKNFIYIDGDNSIVKSGYAIKNQIFLNIESKKQVKYMTYLPPFIEELSIPYSTVVNLSNSMGLRAFSFAKHKIENLLLKAPILSIKVLPEGTIFLKWEAVNDAIFHIERSSNRFDFKEIMKTNNSFFNDIQVQSSTNYSYRIWYETKINQSEISSEKNISFNCQSNTNVSTLLKYNFNKINPSNLINYDNQSKIYKLLNQSPVFEVNKIICK